LRKIAQGFAEGGAMGGFLKDLQESFSPEEDYCLQNHFTALRIEAPGKSSEHIHRADTIGTNPCTFGSFNDLADIHECSVSQ
jgi:hypothetical protein